MLNFIKTIIAIITFKLKGQKPTRFRVNGTKSLGYTVTNTSGGKSDEGFTRVTMGKRVSYFPNYNRNGAKRANKYVPFKQHKGKMIFQHLNAIN
tara:strand:- start:272 stop:553 length:282 start_codon:yes stop_codon:yes gene_type:complete